MPLSGGLDSAWERFNRATSTFKGLLAQESDINRYASEKLASLGPSSGIPESGMNDLSSPVEKVEKGFFYSSDKVWTCYRRNYFEVRPGPSEDTVRRVLGYNPHLQPSVKHNSQPSVSVDVIPMGVEPPYSIQDSAAAIEYCKRLKNLRHTLDGDLAVLMRTYLEKPRTTIGWKGLMNDPDINESFKINKGLHLARKVYANHKLFHGPSASQILDNTSLLSPANLLDSPLDRSTMRNMYRTLGQSDIPWPTTNTELSIDSPQWTKDWKRTDDMAMSRTWERIQHREFLRELRIKERDLEDRLQLRRRSEILILKTRKICNLLSMSTLSTILVLPMFINPVRAVDPFEGVIGIPSRMTQAPPPYAQRVAIGGCIGIAFILGGRLRGAASNLVAPIMGFSSVLFVMLRNDRDIRAETAWAVFGVWSMTIVAYLWAQVDRLVYFHLYMLTSTVLSGICMCIVASVQRSSLQGGLVTAIPPCVAFSSYASTFVFREHDHHRYQ